VVKSRVGDYRREHWFTLRQSLEAYRYYQDWITGCDPEREEPLQNLDGHLPPDAPALPPERYPHRQRKNEFRFAMGSKRYRIFGVDLTAIPSLNALPGYTLLAEVGTNGSKFPNLHGLASWACFCAHNQKSGGKVLSAKTRKSANRVNRALRRAAQTLERSTSDLGIFLSQDVRPLGKAGRDHGYRPQTSTHHFSQG
jgi:transposase